jgi:hypothetical protein
MTDPFPLNKRLYPSAPDHASLFGNPTIITIAYGEQG